MTVADLDGAPGAVGVWLNSKPCGFDRRSTQHCFQIVVLQLLRLILRMHPSSLAFVDAHSACPALQPCTHAMCLLRWVRSTENESQAPPIPGYWAPSNMFPACFDRHAQDDPGRYLAVLLAALPPPLRHLFTFQTTLETTRACAGCPRDVNGHIVSRTTTEALPATCLNIPFHGSLEVSFRDALKKSLTDVRRCEPCNKIVVDCVQTAIVHPGNFFIFNLPRRQSGESQNVVCDKSGSPILDGAGELQFLPASAARKSEEVMTFPLDFQYGLLRFQLVAVFLHHGQEVSAGHWTMRGRLRVPDDVNGNPTSTDCCFAANDKLVDSITPSYLLTATPTDVSYLVYANNTKDDAEVASLIEICFAADRDATDDEQDAVADPEPARVRPSGPNTDADRHPNPAPAQEPEQDEDDDEDVDDDDDARSGLSVSKSSSETDNEQEREPDVDNGASSVAASPRGQYDQTPRAEHGCAQASLPDYDDHDENPDAMHTAGFILSPVFLARSQRVPIARQPAARAPPAPILQLHPDPAHAGTGDVPPAAAFLLAGRGAPLLAGAGGGTDDAPMHTGADAWSVDDLPVGLIPNVNGDMDGAPGDEGAARRGRKRKELGQVGSLQEAVAQIRQLHSKNQAHAALKFAGIAPGKNAGNAYFDKLDQACTNPAQAARLAEHFKVPVPAAPAK